MSIFLLPALWNAIQERELREKQRKLTNQDNEKRKREEKRNRLKVNLGDIFALPGKKNEGREFIINNILGNMFEYAEYINDNYNNSALMSMPFNEMNSRVRLTGKNHFSSNGGAMLDYTINEDIDLKVGDFLRFILSVIAVEVLLCVM